MFIYKIYANPNKRKRSVIKKKEFNILYTCNDSAINLYQSLKYTVINQLY